MTRGNTQLFLGVLMSLFLIVAAKGLKPVHPPVAQVHVESEPSLLPKLSAVRLVTFGYDRFASDILWFLTVNYFGKSYRERGDFRWLKHYCSLTTTLAPHALDRIEFCATLLAWMARDPAGSSTLLQHGIEKNPDDWRLRYLLSFNHWYFTGDAKGGAEELKQAASLPGAPESLAGIAAKLLASADDPNLAVQYLEETLSRTESSAARSALSIRLRQALLSRDLFQLRQYVTQYENRFAHLPKDLDDLVTAGFLEELPTEPFGGAYTLDPQTGEVRSTSGKKGLSRFGEGQQKR